MEPIDYQAAPATLLVELAVNGDDDARAELARRQRLLTRRPRSAPEALAEEAFGEPSGQPQNYERGSQKEAEQDDAPCDGRNQGVHPDHV